MSSPVPRATLASWEQVPNCWLVSPNHGGGGGTRSHDHTHCYMRTPAPCLPQMMGLLSFWTPLLKPRIAAGPRDESEWIH